MPQGSVFDYIIGLFLLFIIGINIFSGTLIATNALLNLAWTVGIPVSVLYGVFRAGGLIR